MKFEGEEGKVWVSIKLHFNILIDGKTKQKKTENKFVYNENNIPSSGSFLKGSACLKRLNFDDVFLSLLLSLLIFLFNSLDKSSDGDADASVVVEEDNNAEQEWDEEDQ